MRAAPPTSVGRVHLYYPHLALPEALPWSTTFKVDHLALHGARRDHHFVVGIYHAQLRCRQFVSCQSID